LNYALLSTENFRFEITTFIIYKSFEYPSGRKIFGELFSS